MDDLEHKAKGRNRTKGLDFERKIASLFRQRGWLLARRHLEPTIHESQYQRDLDGTDPFHVQCKNTLTYPPLSTYLELQPQHANQIPLLIAKGRQGQPTLVTIALTDFMNLITPATPGRATDAEF